MKNSRSSVNPQNQASQFAIWGAMITIYIVWGSTYLAIRFAVATIPPFLMASMRFLAAGLILFVFRLLSGDPWPRKNEWRSSAIIGLFLLVLGNGGVVWAEQMVPSSLAALMVGTVPLWMIIINSIQPGGHWPNRKVIIGVSAGFAGILLLFWPGQASGEPVNFTGILVLLFAAISWAIGSLFSRKAVLPASPLQGTAMEMLAGGTMLLIAGILTGETASLHTASFTPQSIWGLIYLVIFGSLIGFVAYTWALRSAPISLVATYAYVNPVVAIAVGYLFAGEIFTIKTFIAAAIILGSVILITTPAKKKIKKGKISAFSEGNDYSGYN